MSFFGGGGGTTERQIVQNTTSDIPEWVKKEGEALFKETKPATERPYPEFDPAARIAPFTPDQQAAFDLTRENVGSWQPAYMAAAGSAANAGAPVSQEDVGRYMNPFSDEVVRTTLDQLYRQNERQKIDMQGQMAQRGSYMNEDRREVMNILRDETANRTAGQLQSGLLKDAFGDALTQGNVDKSRGMDAASIFSQLAPMASQLGSFDATQLKGVGDAEQMQEQQLKDLTYDEFIKQFYYPQEQSNYLAGLLRQTPYATSGSSSQNQFQAMPNTGAQDAGAIASIIGALGIAGMAMSRREVKQNIRPVEHILPRMKELEVSAYEYREGWGLRGQRVGPMQPDFTNTFGVGDGIVIQFMDVAGVVLAAIKEIIARMEYLEGEIDALTV